MKSSNINLITKDNFLESRNEKVKRIKYISYFLLVIIAFVSIVIFLVNYRFSFGSLVSEQNNLLEELSVFSESAAKIHVLNSRIDNTAKIINTRNKHNETILVVTQNLPSNVDIEEFELDEFEIAIAISSNSLEGINEYLNSLFVLAEDKGFTSVTLDELSIKGNRYYVKISAVKI